MTTAVKKVPSDIAIAQAAELRPIRDVAAELGLSDDELELYGKYKAKISLRSLASRASSWVCVRTRPRAGRATSKHRAP